MTANNQRSEQHYFADNGITVPYVEYGSPDERPSLVLLNGISMPPSKWGEFPVALDRHAIAIGLPGPEHMSCWPTMNEYSRVTVSALRGLARERAHILGLSWGGLLAQQVAADYPRAVNKMVLAATMPATMAAAIGIPKPRAALGVISANRSPEKAGMMYGGDLLADPSLINELGIIRDINPLHHMRQQQAVMASSWPLIIRRIRSNTETLVMAGDDDPIIRFRAAKAGAFLLGAELKRIKKGGHGFLFTRPKESAKIVNAFLDRPARD